MSNHHGGDIPSSKFIEQFKNALNNGEGLTPQMEMQKLQDRLLKDSAKSGKTGDYPEGMYGPEDEGAVRFGIAADVRNNKVALNFGTPVAWMAMSPDQARNLGQALIKCAGTVEAGTVTRMVPVR